MHHEVDIRLALIGCPALVGELGYKLSPGNGDEAVLLILSHKVITVAVELRSAVGYGRRDERSECTYYMAVGVLEHADDIAVGRNTQARSTVCLHEQLDAALGKAVRALRCDRPAVAGVGITRFVKSR